MSTPSHVGAIGNVNIRFPVTFSAVCAVAVLALTAIYYDLARESKETLIFFAACVAAAGQITASFYTARMLSAAIAQNAQTAEHDRLAAEDKKNDRVAQEKAQEYEMLRYTVRFGERWNNPEMYHARDTLRELLDFQGSNDDLIKLVEAKKTNVIHIFNFIEEIGTAKKFSLIKHEICREQFDHIVCSVWVKLNPWITKHRDTMKNRKIWEEFEALFDAWKKP